MLVKLKNGAPMKYRPGYPKDGFASIEEAREWVSNFVHWYNTEHYHSEIKFMTPNSRHNGETDSISSIRRWLSIASFYSK